MNAELLSLELQAKIAKAGGVIPFSTFMESVLYTPELGYYQNGKKKFGREGDFVTAPEISFLFSACIAKQCQRFLETLGGGDILELGAGTGQMARVMIERLSESRWQGHYFILETSPSLQAIQQETLAAFSKQVVWLTTLPMDFTGIILANEVMDALPVSVFTWERQVFWEKGVSYDASNNRFVWQTIPISAESELAQFLQTLPAHTWPEGYTSEVSLWLTPLIKTLGECLKKGKILLIDYGYERSTYYRPERSRGTLRCYFRHQAHDDPLIHLGEQDITAHVDFTWVAEAGIAVGLKPVDFMTQANFLLQNDILTLFEEASLVADPLERIRLQKQLECLLYPHEMGEAVKCMIFSANT